MTLSPMQHGYVTKKEFNELTTYMDEGFDMTNKHIDNLEIHMDKKFANLEGKMNVKFENLEVKMNTRFSNLEVEMNTKFSNLESKMDAKFTEQKEDIMAFTKVVNKIAAKII